MTKIGCQGGRPIFPILPANSNLISGSAQANQQHTNGHAERIARSWRRNGRPHAGPNDLQVFVGGATSNERCKFCSRRTPSQPGYPPHLACKTNQTRTFKRSSSHPLRLRCPRRTGNNTRRLNSAETPQRPQQLGGRRRPPCQHPKKETSRRAIKNKTPVPPTAITTPTANATTITARRAADAAHRNNNADAVAAEKSAASTKWAFAPSQQPPRSFPKCSKQPSTKVCVCVWRDTTTPHCVADTGQRTVATTLPASEQTRGGTEATGPLISASSPAANGAAWHPADEPARKTHPPTHRHQPHQFDSDGGRQ